MKVILACIIRKISEVEQRDGFKVQRIHVEVEQFNATNGEKKESQFFDVALFNNKIEDFKADNYLDQKVNIACYLRSIKREQDGKVFYNIVLNGHSIVKR